MHDHFIIPVIIYESVAQSRGLFGDTDQSIANSYIRNHYRRILARVDPCIDIPCMDNLHSGIGLCAFLDALHDNLEYSYCLEVRLSVLIFLLNRGLTISPSRFFAWYLFGISGCLSPILYSTVNTIVKDDSEERALIMVSPCILRRTLRIDPILKAVR